MKTLLLLAGAAALGFASPAVAKPGNGHGQGHGPTTHVHGGHGKGSLYGKGLGGCPPGHSKHPGVCMPHGQYKKLFEVGQRVPFGYRGLLGYNGLPYDVRDRYGAGLDPYSRYIYEDDYLYRIDPRTMVVSQILRAIL